MTTTPHSFAAGTSAGLLVALAVFGSADAHAQTVTCDLSFHLQEAVTVAAVQFNVDYSATGGSIPGSGGAASCVNQTPSGLIAFNDDDGTGVLRTGLITIEGITGPDEIVRCTFESNTVPDVGDIVVTEIDSPSESVAGNTTNVCGAPETGLSPPYARDAEVILKHAVGMPTSCQPCEGDVNQSGQITAIDSLTTLRTALGTATTSCDPCVGIPTSTGPAENVTITAQLDCTYACPPEPDPINCPTGVKSTMAVLNDANPAKHSVRYKVVGGPATDQADFGNPVSDTTYSLCIYDQSLGAYSLEDELTITPSASWTDKDPKGFIYKDPSGAVDGAIRISLKTGLAGKSKIRFQTGGMNTPMPVPFSGTEMFDAESVVVNLHNNSTSDCWGATFATSLSNTPVKFTAKNP